MTLFLSFQRSQRTVRIYFEVRATVTSLPFPFHQATCVLFMRRHAGAACTALLPK